MKFIKLLSENLQKVAIDELGEVPSQIPKALQALKLWLQKQPHLKACTDDQFLIQFLRGCKYNLEKAQEKLDLFYTLKSKYPELYTVRDVDDKRFKEILNYKCFAILPKPLNDLGPRILVFRTNFTLENHRFEEIFQAVNVPQEIMMLNDPYACIYGIVWLLDFGEMTSQIASEFTPSFLKKQVAYHEKSMPFRIKMICFINVSPIGEAVLKRLVEQLSEELRKRVVICGQNASTLAEHIPLKYLPKEYGGENGSLDEVCAENNKLWHEYREYFERTKDYGSDESLRPGDPIDFDSLFGMGETSEN